MQDWQEGLKAAGINPSKMAHHMHQFGPYGHRLGRGRAPIFITNYSGQLPQGQTGYSEQPFQQEPSNNFPNVVM